LKIILFLFFLRFENTRSAKEEEAEMENEEQEEEEEAYGDRFSSAFRLEWQKSQRGRRIPPQSENPSSYHNPPLYSSVVSGGKW